MLNRCKSLHSPSQASHESYNTFVFRIPTLPRQIFAPQSRAAKSQFQALKHKIILEAAKQLAQVRPRALCSGVPAARARASSLACRGRALLPHGRCSLAAAAGSPRGGGGACGACGAA